MLQLVSSQEIQGTQSVCFPLVCISSSFKNSCWLQQCIIPTEISNSITLRLFFKLLVLTLMPPFPPAGITFVLTSHIFELFSKDKSKYFSTFSSSFFSHLSMLLNCHNYNYNFTALVFLVSYHKIRSPGPNFMVFSNTKVPQKFVVVIFKHVSGTWSYHLSFRSNPHFTARFEWIALATVW